MFDRVAGRWRAGARGVCIAIAAALAMLAAACERSTPYKSTQSVGRVDSGLLAQQGTTAPVGERRAFTRQSGNNLSTGQLQVNGYLWRAALDTVSFMPLSSADPYGGVIITDWYSPPETPDERFKVTVLVRGQDLRSDGVKVTVFRQKNEPPTGWVDSEVDNNTQVDMENIILSQARALRTEAQNAGN